MVDLEDGRPSGPLQCWTFWLYVFCIYYFCQKVQMSKCPNVLMQTDRQTCDKAMCWPDLRPGQNCRGIKLRGERIPSGSTSVTTISPWPKVCLRMHTYCTALHCTAHTVPTGNTWSEAVRWEPRSWRDRPRSSSAGPAAALGGTLHCTALLASPNTLTRQLELPLRPLGLVPTNQAHCGRICSRTVAFSPESSD
jgi:hypothetical protein